MRNLELKINKENKIKGINRFGDLLHDVLWLKSPENKSVIEELENLIESKVNFDFTKEEFIEHYLIKGQKIKNDPIDEFILFFYEDSYDAVTFKTTGYNTIQLLRDRIKDFDILIEEIYCK